STEYRVLSTAVPSTTAPRPVPPPIWYRVRRLLEERNANSTIGHSSRDCCWPGLLGRRTAGAAAESRAGFRHRVVDGPQDPAAAARGGHHHAQTGVEPQRRR